VQPADDLFRGVQMRRFGAALLVVWAHANDSAFQLGLPAGRLATGALENLGAFGVDVFFVLSGFIIALTVRRRPELTPTGFLRARWLRVGPVYFAFSLPWIAAAVANGLADPARWAATFLFWPAFGEQLTQPFLPIGWSLCFEMLFYAAVACTLGAGGVRPAGLLALYAACAGLAFAIGGPVFRYLGSPLILEFLAGVAIALAYRRSGPRGPLVGALALAAALAWLTAFAAAGDPGIAGADLASRQSLLRVACWGPPATLLVLAAVLLEPRIPDTPVVRLAVYLGRASYCIYLTHLLALLVLASMLAGRPVPGGADGWVLLALAASTAVGALAMRLLEDPLRRRLSAKATPGRLRPAAAAL
jgi:exopolysaccharide production protein ExoZ